MRFVILGHGKDRDHGNRPFLSLLPSGPFINRRKVCIHISRIASSSRNLFAGRRYLAESVRIVCDIRQDDKHMHILFKGKVLRRRQRHPRRCDTFYRRIIGKVHKHYRSVDSSRILKALHKIIGFLKSDPHSREYNRKGL